MNDQAPIAASGADTKFEARAALRSYLWGLGCALLLTLSAFALVYWALLPQSALLIVIGILALVQMAVHFRYFLHIGWRENREDLQLLLFSALLLFIMVVGTLWIMASLAKRMGMPMLV